MNKNAWIYATLVISLVVIAQALFGIFDMGIQLFLLSLVGIMILSTFPVMYLEFRQLKKEREGLKNRAASFEITQKILESDKQFLNQLMRQRTERIEKISADLKKILADFEEKLFKHD